MFHVEQTVFTVGFVPKQHGIVRHRGRTIGVAHKAVVGHDIAIDRNVLVNRLVSIKDLTNNRELTGVQCTIDHQLAKNAATEHHVALKVEYLAVHILDCAHRVAIFIGNRDPHV